MPSNEFAINNVWASQSPEGTEEEVTVPSGQTCRARRMSIQAMIEAGMLSEADALTAQVSKYTRKIRGAKGKADGSELDTRRLMQDPEAVKTLISMMDRAIPKIVVSPVVNLHYTEHTVGKTTVTKKIPIEDREPGAVYTDQLDFGDKMFLFDWAAGGLASMLTFRE
jgi:hypothetical protein